MSKNDIPELEGQSAAARDHNGGHIQIIASAGSGKTETVAQRVARLVDDGVDPKEIVAFTFTTRAAEELKVRIRERVEARAGVEAADKLGTMYVGTIHGYCFQLLSEHIGIYESYEVLDENQLAAFVLRYATKLNVKQFSPKQGMFDGIGRLLENIQIVENELLDWDEMPEDFANSALRLYQLLDEHRLLTYGLQIDRALKELEKPEVHASVTSGLKHLIVDEYQDVNPAQEKLISLLAAPLGQANLVVVGDDDQAHLPVARLNRSEHHHIRRPILKCHEISVADEPSISSPNRRACQHVRFVYPRTSGQSNVAFARAERTCRRHR